MMTKPRVTKGALCTITANVSNHKFEIGEVVRILNKLDQQRDWKASRKINSMEDPGSADWWYVKSSELDRLTSPDDVTAAQVAWELKRER